jgi:PAS domain S-box-containing protein
MCVARAKSSYTDLIDEELSLRALVDASHDAIIGKTLDGIIVSWNNGAEKIYGYKVEEVLGKAITVLIPPGHPNEFPEIMIRLRRGILGLFRRAGKKRATTRHQS